MGGVYTFDVELTSFDGQIIEAAWLRLGTRTDLAGDESMIDTIIADAWVQRFKPDVPISFGAMAIHNILPSELEQCPPTSSFALPAECAYIIGHSIDSDWKAAGSPANVKRICTHAIAQWLWPDATGFSQSALIYMLEGATPATRILLRGAHNALADVQLNLKLLQHIRALKPDIQTWQQLWDYSEQCRIPRTCPLKRWDGVLLADMDDGAIAWCLGQYWISEYFRKGLKQVMEARYANSSLPGGRDPYFDDDRDDEDDDFRDEDDVSDDSRPGDTPAEVAFKDGVYDALKSGIEAEGSETPTTDDPIRERMEACAKFRAHDRVIYIPGHANRDRHHPDCEHGAVSSQNGHSVFVKLDAQLKHLPWDDVQSQSCDPADLVFEDEAAGNGGW